MWKDFFYFTKTEKQGIILLVALIVIAIVAGYGWEHFKEDKEIVTDDSFEQDYAAFIESIKEKEIKTYSHQNDKSHRTPVILSAFDPNTADSATFTQLGLPPWMALNIVRYREKGGKFKKPEDFRKIYGMTDEQYNTLYPYIHISPIVVPQRDTIRLLTKQENRDTFPKTIKYPEGTILNINEADTTELKKIPGIGSGIARMITGYRTQLGGFYSIHQLKEIDLDAEALSAWFTVGDKVTRRINLNKVSVERLRNHPYFNFYQAKAIVEFRKKRGTIKSLSQLALLEEFTENDFQRIQYYVAFE